MSISANSRRAMSPSKPTSPSSPRPARRHRRRCPPGSSHLAKLHASPTARRRYEAVQPQVHDHLAVDILSVAKGEVHHLGASGLADPRGTFDRLNELCLREFLEDRLAVVV